MSSISHANSPEDGFQFIVSSGPRPDPAARKTIRRQAMKEAGLNRRRRNQTETCQKVPSIEAVPNSRRSAIAFRNVSPSTPSTSTLTITSGSSKESTPGTELTRSDSSIETDQDPTDFEQHPILLPSLDFVQGEYWHARSKSNVDLSSLAILTNFNIGKSTTTTLASSTRLLPSVLSHQQWSYLEYIPQRYPHSPCLAAATDCILARVSNILSPSSGGESSALRLYAKALRLVQNAVAGPSSLDSDVLCAVQLLSLNELFDASRSNAWASHIEGSSRLIRYRSVNRFGSDFEKALFAASVGPYVSQCLYKGTHCYLAEPRWKDLYLSLALAEPQDCLSERSKLVLDLRSQMFSLPGLWSDVERAVKGDDLFDDDMLEYLTKRCREARLGYLDSLKAYKAHVLRTAFTQPSPSELALRREFYGLAHEGLILVLRLQASVCDAKRLSLEAEVLSAAQIIFEMQDQPLPQHSWLFSGHELGVAQLAVETSEQFTEDVSAQSWKDQRLAMRRRYMLWSGSLRAF